MSALDAIRRELADRERQRELLTRDIEALQRTVSILEVKESDGDRQPAKTLRNTAAEIMRERGEAIYYRDLVGLLEERGVIVGGLDKAKNVSAHLSQDSRFATIGEGRWTLVSLLRTQ